MRAVARRGVKLSAVALDRLRAPRRGVVVLLYHRVGARSGWELDLPVALFHEQMSELAASGRATTLDRALEALRDPEPPARDPVVVTFDDGTADFAEVALPVLSQYQIPATLYLSTDFVESSRPFPGGGRPLSWTALADATSTGLVTIGSHTNTHALLDRCRLETAEEELERSIELIGSRLQVDARHFAYPKALRGTGPVADAVRRRFDSAALGGCRPNSYGATDPYELARSPIQTADGMRFFRRKLAGGMALEESLRGAFARVRYMRART
jgi:peptidoglycan/xylan/chitin deacetylase (PgdA/CDA1 family)